MSKHLSIYTTQRDSVLRTDVRLRVEHPHITTKIFEIGPLEHIIFVSKTELDVTDYSEEFCRSIKQVTDSVALSNSIPNNAVEIPCLSDRELGNSVRGLPLTVFDLEVILAGNFPSAPPLVSGYPLSANTLKFEFTESLSVILLEKVQNFLEAQFRGYSIIIGYRNLSEEGNQNKIRNLDTSIFIKPARDRSSVPGFVASDEQWWFENIGAIFDGSLPPQSFEITHDAGYSCYMHGTGFPNMDIRQALLAYDTIFIEPPLTDGQGGEQPFWKSQDISDRDLLRLIEADRVRLIHAQPEERSDLGFLREAYETNPKGVCSRRKLAGLVIADTVQTADEYAFGNPNIRKEISTAISMIADELNCPASEISKGILYPLYLRRAALMPFLKLGAMGLATHNQGSLFADIYKRQHSKDVFIEADAFGQSVHISHVLNATYIPHVPHTGYVSTWIEPMRLFGDRLNFYRSFNTRIAAAWAENERRKTEERAVVLPSVPLIRFDRHASIEHVLAYTSRSSDRRKGRSLIARLANLPEGERYAEVDNLQKELFELNFSRDRQKSAIQWLDVGSGVAAYTLGINLPPFFAGGVILSILLEKARNIPGLDRIFDTIQNVVHSGVTKNEDLDILSKVSRVATLR